MDKEKGRKRFSRPARVIGIGLMLVIQNLVVVAAVFGFLIYIDRNSGPAQSDWEKMIQEQGLGIADIRARAPYVMFQPRMSRQGHRLDLGNVVDPQGFARVVVAAANAGTPSPGLRVWELLSDISRNALVVLAAGDQLSPNSRDHLSGNLVKLIAARDFFDRSYFPDIEISEYFEEVLATGVANVHAYEYEALNSHVFSAAFRDFLSPKWLINSYGFFSPEISKRKKPGEYRIAMLGGSMVFSARTYETSTIGALAKVLVEREPSLQGREVTYINAGNPSAVSNQELARLIHVVLDFSPDLLVVFDGFNDFYVPLHGFERRVGYPYDYIVEEFRFADYSSATSLTRALRNLGARTEALSNPFVAINRYYEALNIRTKPLDSLMPEILDNYFTNIERMVTVANAIGLPAAVFLQPYSPKHLDPARLSDKRVIDVYEKASRRFAELSRRNSAMQLFADLSDVRHALIDDFVDVVHYKQEKGNPLVAKLMYEQMKAAGMFGAAAAQ